MTRTGRTLVTLAMALGLGACKPDLGAPPSLVVGPRILAIRGTPPDAPTGTDITYDALIVDANGRVATPNLGWAYCLEPHPPAESNIVSSACLTPPEDAFGPTFTAPIPSGDDDACSLFGPITPNPKPGQPATRPADPDVTGGYYQPVRMTWYEDDGSQQMAFSLERIMCRLANAPSDVAGEFAMKNVPNNNPVIAGLTLDPDGAATTLFDATQSAPAPPGTVAAGQTVALEATWPAGTAETFLIYDIATHVLGTETEALRLAWFVTGGDLQFDATGRTEMEADKTTTRNVWTAPTTPGPVHLWAVLRDSRGGIDFAEAEIDVTQ